MSRRPRLRAIAIAILLAVRVVPTASAASAGGDGARTTAREVARTFATHHVEVGARAEAQRVLAEHLAADARDGETWNLLGVLLLDGGDAERAATAFRRALEAYEAGDRPRVGRGAFFYNLADAQARLGDGPAARGNLAQAEAEPETRRAARRALGRLQPGRPLPELFLDDPAQALAEEGSKPRTIIVNLGAIGGFDTNVILASDATYGSASFFDAASPSLGAYAQVGASSHRLERNWDALLLGNYNYLLFTNAQRLSSLSGSLGVDWGRARPSPTPPPREWLVAATGDSMWLNSDGYVLYNWNLGVRPHGLLRLGGGLRVEPELGWKYQSFARASGVEDIDERSGVLWRPGATLRWGSLSAGLFWEENYARGANYRARALFLPLALGRAWGKTSVSASLEATRTLYFESVSARVDHQLKTGLSLSRAISPSVTWVADYAFRRNTSNVETARYGRHSITFTLDYAAF